MRIDKDARAYAAKYIREAAKSQKPERQGRAKRQLPDSDAKDTQVKDVLELTEDAVKKAQEQQKKLLDDEAAARKRGGMEPMDISTYIEQLENAKEQGEAVAEYFEDYIKCIKIALRIMTGDRVPPADHKFLAEKEPDMYSRAVSMKMKKKDPVDHDRLSEDEEEDESGAEEPGGIEAAGSVDAPPMSASAETAPAEAPAETAAPDA